MRRTAMHLGLVFGFIFGIALTVSPALHERFHADAKQAHHECAVTVFASGSCHHAGAPKIRIPSASASQFGRLPALAPVWVPAAFSSSHIFEHAPPAQA